MDVMGAAMTDGQKLYELYISSCNYHGVCEEEWEDLLEIDHNIWEHLAGVLDNSND